MYVDVTHAAAAKLLQSCPTLCDPIDGSHQAPPSLGFSRQEHWSGLPLPSPVTYEILFFFPHDLAIVNSAAMNIGLHVYFEL